MDRALARFATSVVARQAAMLLALAAIVVAMAWWVYARTRDNVIDQAARRQMLLAEQTARGIESYYDSIIQTLDLLHRSTASDATASTGPAESAPHAWPGPASRSALRPPGIDGPLARQILLPVFWEQLQDRVSQVFLYDRDTHSILIRFAEPDALPAESIIQSHLQWLDRVAAPSVSSTGQLAGRWGNLVVVPVAGGRRLICAVVPAGRIESTFLTGLRQRQLKIGATIMDDESRVIASHEPALVGLFMLRDAPDPRLRQAARNTLASDQPRSHVFEQTTDIAGITLGAAITTVHPVRVADRRWWVAVSSSLAEVEGVIRDAFRRTAAFAAVAIGVFTFAFSRIAFTQIRERSRVQQVRAQLLQQEIDQARRIQLAWLPSADASVPGLDIAACNRPASHISGDFYNWFDLPDGRACVVIGDVTGHGMSAAFLMATTQLLLRAAMQRLPDPGAALTNVNRELCQQVFSGQFVTILVIAIDTKTGRLDLATAGHPPPVLIDPAGKTTLLPVEPELVAGIVAETQYTTQPFSLDQQSTLLLYTDGVPEALSPDERPFGDAGLLACPFRTGATAADTLETALVALDRFRGPVALADDATLVCLRLA